MEKPHDLTLFQVPQDKQTHPLPPLTEGAEQGTSASSEEKIIVWKHAGETLDQLLDRVRSASSADKLGYNISPETKITYAGRLDPLASGIMIVLTGNAVHEKDLYNKLDKYYRAKLVLGFETDTYDVLGVVAPSTRGGGEAGGVFSVSTEQNKTHPLPPLVEGATPKQLQNILQSQIGKHIQTYPPYSSKNIGGVPMWKLARDGQLPDVLPSREVEIYKAILDENFAKLPGEKLFQEIKNIVSRVTGDFRQQEILETWQENIESEKNYQILEIDYHVSSGTYIRGLVHELGKQLGTGAVMIELERYQVGNYKKSDIL